MLIFIIYVLLLIKSLRSKLKLLLFLLLLLLIILVLIYVPISLLLFKGNYNIFYENKYNAERMKTVIVVYILCQFSLESELS